MSCHSAVTEWTTIIRLYLPQLSQPQATVLALWSLGIVLARSCALTAVTAFLAVWLARSKVCGNSCESSVTKPRPSGAISAKPSVWSAVLYHCWLGC